MRKFYWLSLITSTVLLGNDRVELFGTIVDTNGSVATATGNPVAVYQDQILSADELTYDHNKSVVEAKGSVNIFKAQQYHVISEYSRADLLNETRYSKPYYMLSQDSGVWMSTDEAQTCKNEIDLASGTLSGCDSNTPLWKIRFSSADYDTEEMWVNLYNARLEIKDIPLFYLPYFGYPTDTTRRTGLLLPSFGWSNSEGFYYQQPIYFAPQNWWDAEFRPQIRTSRGSGIYTDFRFIDTPSSQGSISMGYFKEQAQYAAEYDLAHIKHYGYDVKYRHTAPLKEWFDLNLEGESGLYVDGSWMNDVDYLNLQHSDETQNVINNQVMSRINTYYSSEDNYVGAYLKHYQYLDQPSNAQTIQTLPSLHYHRYLENLLDDHFLISADAMATNFYRPDGKRAVEADFTIPMTLQTALFDEYLDVSYTANATSKVIGFYGNPKSTDTDSYEKGLYAQLDHTLSLSSTLVRPYETLTHVIAPSVSYTLAGNRYYDGYYKTYHSNGECIVGSTNPACEYYTLNEPSDTLSLGLNNYLFEGGKQLFVDRLSQNFRYDDQGSYYGELQNELEWTIGKAISIYNQTAYNHDRNRVTKEQNTLRYNDGIVNAGVSHYYTDELRNNTPVYASYWNADAAYQYNQHYRFFTILAYDYREDLLKRSEIGFLYSQRCLDFGIRYVQNRRPVLTNNVNNNSVDDSYIFFTIILKPIGGSEFNYKMTK
ncbi:LPS-assembly protein LptD [Sulfuricurvum sp.]|uniref:LPS-assembly protein LptD n=1 Tax=Sulfuricurvum sp. TaxID=2025608 RepID=UPI003BB19740